VLWLEGNGERIAEFVLSHGCNSDILWVREVWLWRSVDITEKLRNFSHTI
jgi:hypothetical protein